MTAMTCKLSGLFSTGEEFDDEDLLGTDWSVHSASGPADVGAAVSSCALRASSVALGEREKNCPQPTALRNGTASSGGAALPAAGHTRMGLRQLSSAQPHSPRPSLLNTSPAKSCVAQDDFDDWDVDLADLDECDGQVGQQLRPPAPPPAPTAPANVPASSAKTLQPSTRGGTEPRCDGTRRASAPARHKPPPPRTLSAPLRSPNPRPAYLSPPPQRPRLFPGGATPFSGPGAVSTAMTGLPRRPGATAGPSPQARSLFGTISPAPSPSLSLCSSTRSPHPHDTPVLTNRLVQLMSACNKPPRKRPRSEAAHRTRTRRFPGPAGLLPEQPLDQSLDQIVVPAAMTPAHGAVARVPSQVSGSQTEEDDFGGGAWAAMKAEMGLDERNPSCFLRSYCVVMVLRKAALKQLAKNKVPNMAVLLKSIVHTHPDAKAVFKDPTGEIQGTLHRQLLEERAEELKEGAVLLLKQVGVFSPSHRNHYLNVTPNNLLRIYAPDGVSLSSTRLPPLVLEPMLPSPPRLPRVLQEPVSRMHLVFDDEEEEEEEEEGGEGSSRDARAGSSGGLREPAGSPAPQHSSWDSDGDLDELLGELPDDTGAL